MPNIKRGGFTCITVRFKFAMTMILILTGFLDILYSGLTG